MFIFKKLPDTKDVAYSLNSLQFLQYQGLGGVKIPLPKNLIPVNHYQLSAAINWILYPKNG